MQAVIFTEPSAPIEVAEVDLSQRQASATPTSTSSAASGTHLPRWSWATRAPAS